jgi:hypothetical protein
MEYHEKDGREFEENKKKKKKKGYANKSYLKNFKTIAVTMKISIYYIYILGDNSLKVIAFVAYKAGQFGYQIACQVEDFFDVMLLGHFFK